MTNFFCLGSSVMDQQIVGIMKSAVPMSTQMLDHLQDGFDQKRPITINQDGKKTKAPKQILKTHFKPLFLSVARIFALSRRVETVHSPDQYTPSVQIKLPARKN